MTSEHLSRQLRRTLYKNALRQALRKSLAEATAAAERETQRRLTAQQYFQLRRQVKADVEEHLLEHGEAKLTATIVETWAHASSRYALRRLVAEILAEPLSPEALERSRRLIAERTATMTNERDTEAAQNGTSDTARHIPAAPSPAYIARHGVGELDRLDFFTELNLLFRDARFLRDSAVRKDGDGERITNPRTFDRSISRRLEILATTIETQKQLWDLKTMEEFYNALVEEVAAESPECARRIQARLAARNVQLGAA
jgi:hypothetical protein